jgi:hypothetical protein
MAIVNWTGAPETDGLKIKWSDGWIDDFPEDEFAEECDGQPRRAFIYHRSEKRVLTEYMLSVTGPYADLNYGDGFGEANSSPDRKLDIGTVRLKFTDDFRTAVKSVWFKRQGRKRFEEYDVPTSWSTRLERSDNGAFLPGDSDLRKRTTLSAVLRPGQMRFRAKLLSVYGGRCAITGCPIRQALEAAHIMPYRGSLFNHIQNGLLLRSDLHRLFDACMFSIDPRSLRVSLCRSLQALDDYRQLDGKRIAVSKQPKLRPALIALQDHWKHFDPTI